ncbi:hypothetical protein [Clostridium tunisiense]|uniref:hypothetical protein n=1 Tax=Clostridium tunisiense TaxID=219748 RepID=UPI0002D73F55|nr:hypothetical protein [Clostridium tunisiense]
MRRVDYKKLRKDLLNKAKASGITLLVIIIENADEDKLLNLSEEYGLDISKYITE